MIPVSLSEKQPSQVFEKELVCEKSFFKKYKSYRNDKTVTKTKEKLLKNNMTYIAVFFNFLYNSFVFYINR